MADKTAQQKEVESKVEEVEKTKPEETTSPVKGDSKPEAEEESVKNGDAAEQENGKEDDVDEKNGDEEETEKVCPAKRKSAGGDAPDGTPAEGATPEKKAKLDEAAEAESNNKAEVAA